MKKIKKQENNFAFIDGQNLYMGTKSAKPAWEINLKKFRIYLKDKYKVSIAYYFLGYVMDEMRIYTIQFKKRDLF